MANGRPIKNTKQKRLKLDPKNGKSYKLKGELAGNKLNLRGYIGISALGRNQTWIRAN